MKTEAILNIVAQTPGLTAKEVAVSYQKDPKAKQQVAYFVLQNLVEKGVLTKATRPKDGLIGFYLRKGAHQPSNIPIDRDRAVRLPGRRRHQSMKILKIPCNMELVEEDVARALAKVIVFPHVDIVRYIAELNKKWRPSLLKNYPNLIRWGDYLYENSACVYPGVRRKSGTSEKNYDRGKYYPAAKAIIDENERVRHFWTFLVLGKSYTNDNYKRGGLDKFELAHILAHKASNMKVDSGLFTEVPNGADEKHHGLFTCASNVALVPKGMAKPSEMGLVRAAVFKRYFELYSYEFAGGLKGFVLPEKLKWYKKLEWLDPVKPDDWKDRIDMLDEARRGWLDRILSKNLSK